jgi:hypothetical protein
LRIVVFALFVPLRGVMYGSVALQADILAIFWILSLLLDGS